MTIVCPKCKGKGHVLDKVAALGLTIFGSVLAFLERNDKQGVTRERCGYCDGAGFIVVSMKGYG